MHERVETDAPGVVPSTATVIVEDPVMRELHATIDRVAAASIHVLVVGETGVGKEVVAERLHERSPRSAGPFVRINCAAIPESLLESELFGHEQGAFTGATCSKPGLIEAAHRGTVLLDEVGDLPLPLQAKLLRVTETEELMRVGGVRGRRVDVRIVSATNRDLTRELERGAFRADLFFRLNGIRIEVPPLRRRPGDIPALARAFVLRAAERLRVAPPPELTPAALDCLLAHPWPGNVRELRNVIERAVLLRSGNTLSPADLGLWPHALGGTQPSGGVRARPAVRSARAHEEERERIVDALDRCQWNQTRAARLLGMPLRTLVTRLGAYEIPRPRKAAT